MSSIGYFAINFARSRLYLYESFLIPLADFFSTGRIPPLPMRNPRFFLHAQWALQKLLLSDAKRIELGYYPSSVLWSWELFQKPRSHLARIPQLFSEAKALSRRRKGKVTKEFQEKVDEALPDYFRRNFHFQKDGYLSERSAALYEHQVELLFAGTADPMRRMLIAPLKRRFRGSLGKGLRILEVGCGTGAATRFLALAFPEAEIVAMDLSKPYLKFAAKNQELSHIQWRQAMAEDLPFGAEEFDAVVSVFLFHELPPSVRLAALLEMKRVLKRGGIMAAVDSLQLGDDPKLDFGLKEFPKEFHEPFYPNYIRNPLERQIQKAKMRVLGKELGFFSKVLWATTHNSAGPKRRSRKG